MIMAIILIGSTNALGGFNIFHEIKWAADEDFTELVKLDPISINDSDAEKIEALEGLSLRSKILLSAVAGAAIQYLLDNDIPFVGEWEIKVEKEVDD
jgi:hypothetical protein